MFKNNERKFLVATLTYDMAYTAKQLILARQRVAAMNTRQLQTRLERMKVLGKLEAFAVAIRERFYKGSILGNSTMFKKYLSLFRICTHKCGFSPTCCFFTNESIRDSTWGILDVRYLMDEHYLITTCPQQVSSADKAYLRFMYGHDSILSGSEMGGHDAYTKEQVDENYIALLRGAGSLATTPQTERPQAVGSLITFQVPLAKSPRRKRPRRNLNL